MQILSIFPSLLTYEMLSPFILRLTVGAFVLWLGYNRYRKEYKPATFLYIISGGLVVLGLYTQIASLLAIAVLKMDFYMDYWKNKSVVPVSKQMYFLYSMAGVILFSLLFTGPGFLAIDLPL